MKKINLVLGAAAVAGLLQGFAGNNASVTPGRSVSKAQLIALTIQADTGFAAKAAIGGMAEVSMGKMAAGKASTTQVKNFGNMMVMDHGKANAELMAIAQKKNITLPAGLDAEHQAKSDSLSKLSGRDFDKAYVKCMVADHKKTLALMHMEAQSGTDPELKAFAANTAPVVQHHLDEIARILSGLK